MPSQGNSWTVYYLCGSLHGPILFYVLPRFTLPCGAQQPLGQPGGAHGVPFASQSSPSWHVLEMRMGSPGQAPGMAWAAEGVPAVSQGGVSAPQNLCGGAAAGFVLSIPPVGCSGLSLPSVVALF